MVSTISPYFIIVHGPYKYTKSVSRRTCVNKSFKDKAMVPYIIKVDRYSHDRPISLASHVPHNSVHPHKKKHTHKLTPLEQRHIILYIYCIYTTRIKPEPVEYTKHPTNTIKLTTILLSHIHTKPPSTHTHTTHANTVNTILNDESGVHQHQQVRRCEYESPYKIKCCINNLNVIYIF